MGDPFNVKKRLILLRMTLTLNSAQYKLTLKLHKHNKIVTTVKYSVSSIITAIIICNLYNTYNIIVK